MKNWSVDVEKLKKYPDQYRLWRLEQLINFGLDGEKIDFAELRMLFPKLNIDPPKKEYLKYLILSYEKSHTFK